MGVPADAGLAELGFEDAKAAELDPFALYQGGGNGVQGSIDGPLGVLPGKTGFFGHGGDKLGFIHKKHSLENCRERNANWYYLSALANNGLGNQVTALEHIRKAVSMEPDNQQYLWTLQQLEHGDSSYRQTAGNYRGFTFGDDLCTRICLCSALNICCFGGRGMFCCL